MKTVSQFSQEIHTTTESFTPGVVRIQMRHVPSGISRDRIISESHAKGFAKCMQNGLIAQLCSRTENTASV